MSATIYMFHAIGKILPDDWADIHYSFSEEKFKEFLAVVKKVISTEYLLTEGNDDGVVLTFDDGHISNYWAAKYIADQGFGSADFFINPELVGNRYYMSWSQIIELSKLGMSIQSHGLDHSYLSDLTDKELKHQLRSSKEIIEEKINKKVTILAPPGGRYDARTVKYAKQLGYHCITNSQPGIVKDSSAFVLPRISVMKNSSIEQLLAAQSTINMNIMKQKIKYICLKVMKSLVGNERYERIRWFILGGDK